MRYSFANADAPTRKDVQYFENFGHRAIWHDGWKATTKHQKGDDFGTEHWALFELGSDFSECHDLAGERPDKVREMIERWWTEAGQYDVLPLDDQPGKRSKEVFGGARERYTYYQGMSPVNRKRVPVTANRSHSILTELDIPDDGAEGVILSVGNHLGGYVVYLKDHRLSYEYNVLGRIRSKVTSEKEVPSGKTAIRIEFAKTGELRGRCSIYFGDVPVGAGEISETLPDLVPMRGLHCGRDGSTPVGSGYDAPYPFTGKFAPVVVVPGDDATA